MADRTHFGFRDVARADKAGLVREVFTSVAGRYDLMNDLMSGGVHRLWKDAALDWLQPRGRTAFVGCRRRHRRYRLPFWSAAAARLRSRHQRRHDRRRPSPRRRPLARRQGRLDPRRRRDLPFPARAMDRYTIAFGLRNVTDIDRALAEAFRVLKIGGRFLCWSFPRSKSGFSPAL